jgi:hypothetical protein
LLLILGVSWCVRRLTAVGDGSIDRLHSLDSITTVRQLVALLTMM